MRKIACLMLAFFSFQLFAETWIEYANKILNLQYSTQQLLAEYADFSKTQTFKNCTSHLENAMDYLEKKIDVLEELADLAIQADRVYDDLRGQYPTLPRAMVQGMADAQLKEYISKTSDLSDESSSLTSRSNTAAEKYDNCQNTEQDTYDMSLEKSNTAYRAKDYDIQLSYLRKAQAQVYTGTEHYEYVAKLIDLNLKLQEALKKEAESDKQEAENVTQTNIGSNVSDANYLANAGIIVAQETEAGYNLTNNVLRQEVIGMAIKLAGITLPTEYTCKNIFRDVCSKAKQLGLSLCRGRSRKWDCLRCKQKLQS